MIVADTSALLAFYTTEEHRHGEVVDAVHAADAILLSPYVVAELDYLIASRHGVETEIVVLRDLFSDAYAHVPLTVDEMRAAADLIDRYRDQEIGITDASLVVLADRFGTHDILTLDRRRFDVLRPLDGGRFNVVP